MKRVVVGMSGGVDSSVAAYLLLKEGYEVIGVTMQIWQSDYESGCCGLSAVEDARAVCNKLNIPYYVLNFRQVFKEQVIDYFVDEYLSGRTPNPCIACNTFVKWEALLNRALQLEADGIATGHYARLEVHPVTHRLTLRPTKQKDQTYALYGLTQEQLSRTLMPVGNYSKEDVRAIAKELSLPVADKPDSQEICFVPDKDYGGFISQYTGNEYPAGDYVDVTGKVLGCHKGIHNYTIGQRKGLGVALGEPMYVKHIDVEKNQVVLCRDEDLFTRELLANNVNLMAYDKIHGTMEAYAKIRYAHKPAKCLVSMENNLLRCEFAEPQRAVTPGQAVVVYKDDYLICGGTIVYSKST